MGKTVKVFAPATVANVGSGFDIMGFAIHQPGDELIVSLNNENKIRIKDETGYNLPLEPEKNVSGKSIQAMLDKLGNNTGFDIVFTRKISPGSGMGSSAASSAGAVFGANYLLGKPFTSKDLIPFAMEGEKLACGSTHADNVAPALLGGFVLIRSYTPLDIIEIDSPDKLYCTVIHPDIEVRTEDSRNILQTEILLKDAVKQWGNVAGLMVGLLKGDYKLIGNSLHDHIIEHIRSILIPGFKKVKQAVIEDGVLGCSISGSGPSIFCLAENLATAEKAGETMQRIFEEQEIKSELYISPINKKGCEIVEEYN